MSDVHVRYEGSRTDTAAIKHVFRDQQGPVGRDLDRKSRLVQDAARKLVRVRTGRLLATIRREWGTGPLGAHVDVVAGKEGLTPYLGYELGGTAPHVIRPTRRKVLRFISGGRVVFAREVHHPGTRGSHFLTRALEVLR